MPLAMLGDTPLLGGSAISKIDPTRSSHVNCASDLADCAYPGAKSWKRCRRGSFECFGRKSSVLSGRNLGFSRFGSVNYEGFHSDFHIPLRESLAIRQSGIRGVGDAFWDGGDSDSTANDCLTPSKGSHEKEDISVLLSLIQDIEPFDVSQISKDVSLDSTDAMKRTISGMLGLLPSDRFHVTVESSHEPLARLLVSSIMTGYTLRNAEYRLCLQRNLNLTEAHLNNEKSVTLVEKAAKFENGQSLQGDGTYDVNQTHIEGILQECHLPDGLGSLTPEAENYIRHLTSKLSFVTKELEECKRRNKEMDIDSMVGEENNDLLDYLRSLEAEKVAELSQPSSLEVEAAIQQVVSGILETMFFRDNIAMSTGLSGFTNTLEQEDKYSEFQSPITTRRDYLARLLFWCMLLGHHMRGLEYRLELSHTLRLSGDDLFIS